MREGDNNVTKGGSKEIGHKGAIKKRLFNN